MGKNKIILISCFSLLMNAAYSDGYKVSNTIFTKKFYAKALGGLVFYDKIKPKCQTCVYGNVRGKNSFSASAALGYEL